MNRGERKPEHATLLVSKRKVFTNQRLKASGSWREQKAYSVLEIPKVIQTCFFILEF